MLENILYRYTLIVLSSNAKCTYTEVFFAGYNTSFIYMAHANQYYLCVVYTTMQFPHTNTCVSEWKRLTKCEMRHYFPREHLLTPLVELAFLVFILL